MISNNFLGLFVLILFGFISVNGEGDEHFLGKYINSDKKLFFATYGLGKKPCQQVLNYRCSNNETHFTVNFKANKKKFCISAIKLISYPTLDLESDSTRSLYCQSGGIGTDHCFLVFEKNKEHIAANIEIYGVSGKKCSLKDRYVGSDPLHNDAYGLPYEFNKEDGWSLERTQIPKSTRFSSEVFYYKDGLFNTQISYLDNEDSLTETREITGKNLKKKFSVNLRNDGKKRISFLDVYWFQESKKSLPKYPYIYYKGECSAKNKTCELIFDTDEPITYALIKVFSNPESDGLRLREKDLGRSS